jgi:hypothetical protein
MKMTTEFERFNATVVVIRKVFYYSHLSGMINSLF